MKKQPICREVMTFTKGKSIVHVRIYDNNAITIHRDKKGFYITHRKSADVNFIELLLTLLNWKMKNHRRYKEKGKNSVL